MIKVGQKIEVLDEIAEHVDEKFATVIYVGNGQLGIEFKNNYSLHSCNNRGEHGHCWYIDDLPTKYRILLTNARFDELNEEIANQICLNKEKDGFKVSENGKIIRLKHDNKTVLIANKETNKLIALSVSDKIEKTYVNHMLEIYNLAEGKGINENLKLEALPIKTETKELHNATTETENKTEKKVYASEEELLRDLGIMP